MGEVRTIGVIEVKCPHCGYNRSSQRGDDSVEFGVCMNCGQLSYTKALKPIDFNKKPTVTCPYCNSTNTKKISNMSKAAHAATFGVFSLGKVTKQWHCNNCKSDF